MSDSESRVIRGARAALVIALSTLAALPASAQTPTIDDARRNEAKQLLAGKLPRSLEDLIARALESSPELRVTAAKLRAAEAEHNQARLRIVQSVVTLYNRREEAKQTIDHVMTIARDTRTRSAAGTVDRAAVAAADLAAANALAEQARIEAQLRYEIGLGGARGILSGETSSAGRGGIAGADSKRTKFVPRPLPAQLAERLAQRHTLVVDGTPLADTLLALNQLSGVSFVLSRGLAETEVPVTLKFENGKSLREILSALTDVEPLAFVARDYGILAALLDEVDHETDLVIAPAPIRDGPPAISSILAERLASTRISPNADYASFEDLLKLFSESVGVDFVVSPEVDLDEIAGVKLRNEVPVSQFLRLICDLNPELVFVEREYGVFLQPAESTLASDTVVAAAKRRTRN